MNITILGSGAWGTALAIMLSKTHSVTLWSFDKNEAAVLEQNRENPMLPGAKLSDSITITNDINAAADKDIVVIATPSFAIAQTAKNLAGIVNPQTIMVNVAKGIDKDTGARLSQVISKELPNNKIVVLTGPSHAEEVAFECATAVVAASESKQAAMLVQEAFMNKNFRVYLTPDIIGAELAAALKNVYALATGICDGMKLGDNSKAAMMTRSLTEMARLGVALGAHSETFAGLAGVGDLIVTCTSLHSRNKRAGMLIGQGDSPEQAIAKVGAVVEGYYATQAGAKLADMTGIDMPILRECEQILYHGKNAKDAMQALMGRNKRHEIEEIWMKDIVWED